jgi:tRNA (guanine-N7-)-methyltransferase
LQQHSLNCLALPWPTNWATLFDTQRPLIVEIGFGNAAYLIALAKANPDCNVIGFEISMQSLEKAEKKIRREKLPNAIAVHSHAETALGHLFTAQSIRQIHINYPDPWFKSRHAGRRLMQRDTLDAIVNRLEPGGILYLATDIAEYAEMSHELLAETPGLENLLDAPWVHQFPERLIVTKYEEKGLREGRPGHYFKYRRNDHPAPLIPVKEELPVPHVVLRSPLSPQEIATRVNKTAFHRDDLHAALMAGFWNPVWDTVLLEVMIEEPTLEQHIALALTPREEAGTYTLKFATFGMPRATEGMHFATDAIASWIVELHPDSEILGKSIRE